LTGFGRFLDVGWHMLLPVFCYVLGSFASMTVLMKNSLMENLGQDYVRTAFAKGLSEKTVIFKHALRNSLIPLATGLGHMFSLILAGSYLIEKVFNINGFGLLGYESLIARDYPVTLGILVIASMLKLIGNIISDLLYCIIDPRIRFS
ncbi:MAG: ABC transporter permease, partial [Candidatus Riflebacteria bacterium]